MTLSEKAQVISDTVKNTIAQFIAFPLALVVAYITARVLGPELLGLVSALAVILKYTSAANLSTLNALNREVPYNIGKGNLQEADTIRSAVLGQMILTGIVLCVGILIASLYIPGTELFKIGLRFIAFFVFFQQLEGYFTFYLRSAKQFSFISKLTLFRSIIHTVAAIILVLIFGIIGLWSSSLIVYIAFLSYILLGKRLQLHPSLDFRKILSLIKIGIPIYIVGTLFNIYLTFDRLIIIKFLSLKSLGLYSLTKMVHQATLLAVPLVSQVMYPRFAEKYGETQDYQSLKPHFEKPMIVLSHLTPVLIGIMFFLLPIFIENFLPQYTEGILAAQIYCGGLFFFSLLGMPANFLITTNKILPYIFFVLLTMASHVGLSLMFINLGWGINGVALGTTTSFMILAILLISFVYKFFVSSFKDFFRFIERLFFPFIVNIGVIAILYFAIPKTILIQLGDLGTLFLRAIIIIFINIPFFYIADRETEIIQTVISLFKARFMVRAKTLSNLS